VLTRLVPKPPKETTHVVAVFFDGRQAKNRRRDARNTGATVAGLLMLVVLVAAAGSAQAAPFSWSPPKPIDS
jgi:hypothetical protein